jgi:hypothetical protein
LGSRDNAAVVGTRFQTSLKNNNGRPGNFLQWPKAHSIGVILKMRQLDRHLFVERRKPEHYILRFSFAHPEEGPERRNRQLDLVTAASLMLKNLEKQSSRLFG